MKFIIIDVGTNRAQEYSAMFEHKFNFTIYYLRRLVGYILGIGSYQRLKWIKEISDEALILRSRRSDIFYIFVEPNPRFFTNKKYKKADLVCNIAISEASDPISIKPLYFLNSNTVGLGSSIYISKPGINKKHFINILNLNSDYFAKMIKNYVEQEFSEHYEVILRINCEGAEQTIIQSFKKLFGKQFNLILGALEDVEKIHGKSSLINLYKFIDNEKLFFVRFTPSIMTWIPALKALNSLIANKTN
jgi:hypothetical protein